METTVSTITVDNVEPSFKAGLGQAQVRQIISKVYPKAKVGNSLKDAFFTNSELGIDNGASYDEVRVAWVEVPGTMTKEEAQDYFNANFPDMTLYKILSNSPILSDDQIQVLNNGLRGEALISFNTKYELPTDTAWSETHVKLFQKAIVERQIVRYGEGNAEGRPADEIVLYNGKPQFRRVEAKASKQQDIDLRTPELAITQSIEMAPAREEVKTEESVKA
jgi:hypothetical protein